MVGAGAGIGGNGGDGTTGSTNITSVGGTGESAGTINIYNTIYAYGGSGGSGGRTYSDGAGRTEDIQQQELVVVVPVGAGGIDPTGGGGFTGGNGECYNYSNLPINGAAGYSTYLYPTAGGYFSKAVNTSCTYTLGIIGGGGGSFNTSKYSGNGGTAGKGGTVNIYNNSKVYAYNGSYKTDAASGTATNDWGVYECPIYAQLGISLDLMRSSSAKVVNNRTGTTVLTELSSYVSNGIITLNYINEKVNNQENKNLGIGSGARIY